jgi:hypothetical protein
MGKRTLSLIVILLGLIMIGLPASAVKVSMAPRSTVFYAIYEILGGAKSPVAGVTVANRLVVLYDPDSSGNIATLYGYSYIGGDGKFAIDPFLIKPLTVGQTCQAAICRGDDGYGSNPLAITVSGIGFDKLSSDLVLGFGLGPLSPAGLIEPAPNIKLWFDKRLYQVLKDPTTGENMPFIVSERPNVRVEFSIADNYFLDKVESAGAYSVTVDPGSSYPELDVMAGSAAGRMITAAGPPDSGKITAMSMEFNLPQPLSAEGDGKHLFVVKARSSGTVGGLATGATAYATVEVLGGPVRIVGDPICYPSPYSISKHGRVTIQYRLSKAADIEIVFADIAGRLTKTLYFPSGQEGGSAGVNKVTWDGRTDRGTLAGNGIYLGTIVAREEGRKLGKVKLPVVD